MKYKLKILPENGGYVGYALLNDEVVFSTSVCKDSIIASRELSTFVATKQPTNHATARHIVTAPTVYAQSASPSPAPSPSRRCCGRG